MGDIPQVNLGGPDLGARIKELVEGAKSLPGFWGDASDIIFQGHTFASTLIFILALIFLVLGFYFVFGVYKARKTIFGLYVGGRQSNGNHKLKGKMAQYWNEVSKHLGGASPADWKLAVIEADSILDSLLVDLGYDGEGLGERLKNVKRENMASLNDAWEAHKVRNRIAHEVDFPLSHVDAKKTISQFERVFREFEYI